MFALILIDFCKGEIVLKANYGASHCLLSYKKQCDICLPCWDLDTSVASITIVII